MHAMSVEDSKLPEDFDEDSRSDVGKVNSDSLTSGGHPLSPGTVTTVDMEAIEQESAHEDEIGGVRRYYQRRATDDIEAGHGPFARSFAQ